MVEVLNVPPNWHSKARCQGEDPSSWWYETKHHEGSRQEEIQRVVVGLSLCARCPVQELCLKQGMEEENLIRGSIWGGKLGGERRLAAGIRHRSDRMFYEGEREFTKDVRRNFAKIDV